MFMYIRLLLWLGGTFLLVGASKALKKTARKEELQEKKIPKRKKVTKVTASTYQKDGKMMVSTWGLYKAYCQNGYCTHGEAQSLIGECHSDYLYVDETLSIGSFEFRKGDRVNVWLQDNGNRAVLATNFSLI